MLLSRECSVLKTATTLKDDGNMLGGVCDFQHGSGQRGDREDLEKSKTLITRCSADMLIYLSMLFADPSNRAVICM